MLQEEIDKEARKYGKKLAIYLKANLEEALAKGRKRGDKSAQESALHFNEIITQTSDGVNIKIVASDSYWLNIEDGRGVGKKMPPSDTVGKKWQNKNNINAKKVYLEIQANYKRKNGLSTVSKKLSKTKKSLSYDDYAKRLSFIFARAIKRDGIAPKPYIQQAINDAKPQEFQKRMSEIMGKNIVLDLNLNNDLKPIKLTF
jgi:hypothetical protein